MISKILTMFFMLFLRLRGMVRERSRTGQGEVTERSGRGQGEG